MIYRKADVKEKGATRGWELLSSYNIDTGVTKAFCKGSVYNNKPNISYCCNILIKYKESHIAGNTIKAFVILGNNNMVRPYRDKFIVFLVVFA